MPVVESGNLVRICKIAKIDLEKIDSFNLVFIGEAVFIHVAYLDTYLAFLRDRAIETGKRRVVVLNGCLL